MSEIQHIKYRFWISVVVFSLMSLVILVVPVTIHNEAKNAFWPTAIAILFWLLAIFGGWNVLVANKKRKAFLIKSFGRDVQKNVRPGVFGFFSNPIAIIADVTVIITMLLFCLAMITKLKDTYFIVILFSLFIWAAIMHCLFNSRLFRITKYKSERK